VSGAGIDGGIVDNIVIVTDRIDSCGDTIQTQKIACLPGNVMVCTRRVATDANGTHYGTILVESQAAAEHVDSADLPPHHRIVGLPIVLRVSAVGDIGIDRIAMLQPKEASTRLNGCK